MSTIKKITSQTRGAAFVEYGALVGLISVISMAAVLNLGGEVRSTFGGTSNILETQGLTVAETATPEPQTPSAPTAVGDGSMTSTEHPVILLGSPADLDPFEGNGQSENAGVLVGTTVGSIGAELWRNVMVLTVNDTNGDGVLADNDNETTPETFTSGGTTYELDSVQVYDAEITYEDDTTADITAVVIQMVSGEIFIAPEAFQNADYTAMTSAPMKSISLDTLAIDDTGYVANRASMEYLVR